MSAPGFAAWFTVFVLSMWRAAFFLPKAVSLLCSGKTAELWTGGRQTHFTLYERLCLFNTIDFSLLHLEKIQYL